MNKQLMLCALMDGTPETFYKMRQINPTLHEVQCMHPTENYLLKPFDQLMTYRIEYDARIIQLQKVMFGNELVGFVGKCPHCSVIYFWMEEHK